MGMHRLEQQSPSGRALAAATCLSTVLLGLSAVVGAVPTAQALGAQTTLLVSRTPAPAAEPSMSPDGRYVVFTADGDLLPPDANGKQDVYLAEARPGGSPYAGDPVLVSADANGEQATGNSREPAISGDGRYVAFTSDSSDLVAGADSLATDVYVRDTRVGTTTRIQGSSLPNGASSQPAISDDGRWIVFTSSASNLVDDDTNGVSDIFLYDRENAVLTRVSTGSSGGQLMAPSYSPAISGNGAAVAFTSENHSLTSIPVPDPGFTYAWHRTVVEGTVTVRQIGASGHQQTRDPSLSGDGVVVAYVSRQSSYQGVSGLGTHDKVFVESLGGHWEWVSDGLGTNVAVGAPALSADGSTVAFTAGTNVRAAETESRYGAGGAGSDGVAAVVVGPGGASEPTVSATGRTFALTSTGSIPGDALDLGKKDVAVVGTAAGDQALHPALDSINGLRKPAPLPFVDPSRIPASATYVEPGPATAGSTRIGSTRIGSTRIGSTRIGSTRIGSTRIGSTRIGSTRIGDLPLTQWPLVTADGWKVLLAGTPFEGLPLASVTFSQVTDWAAANLPDERAEAIHSLTLGDFAPEAPFGALTLVSVLLLEKPVAQVPVPGDPQATDLANWKAAVAAQGFDPALVTAETTLLDLDGRGVDIDLTGVGGARASAVAPAQTAMQWIRVSGLSLDNPLGSVRVEELSAAAANAVVDCSGVANCPEAKLGELSASGKIRTAATLADLVPGLPLRMTLDEIVRSLLDPLDFPWEQLSWDSLGAGRYNIPDDPGPGERTGITEVARYRAGFDTGPGGDAQVRNAVLEVQLPPGTAFHEATLTATGPLAYVTPYTPESGDAEQVGDLVRFQLGDVPTGTTITVSVRSSDATNYQQDNSLRAVLRSATGQDDAIIRLQGYAGYDQLVDPDAGDRPATAPVLDVPNRIYFGGITPAAQGQAPDVDYVLVPRPAPGKRLILASGTVGPQIDIGVFQLTSSENAPANGGSRDPSGPGSSPLLEDDLAGVGAGHQLPAPLNIWDEPGWSLLDSSTHTGTQEELVTVDGDGRGGQLLVKIQAADGAGSLMPYTLRYAYVDVAPEQRCPAYVPKHENIPLLGGGLTPPLILPGTNTIFLIDQNRLAQEYGTMLDLESLSLVDAGTWVAQALADLDGEFGVKSAIIPITGLDPLNLHNTQAVVDARAQLDRNPCSVSASNNLAREIQDLLGTYLTTEQSWADLKNIVLVGGDDQLPFWRVEGGTFGARETDNEGALRLSSPRTNACSSATQPELPCDRYATPLSAAAAGDFLLTDDAYGDIDPVGVLDRDLFVPEVAVARLVETPNDIRQQVSTFLQRGGQLQADSALSTGYGAWDEVPAALVDALSGRTAPGNHQRLNGAWTRQDLTSRLFPSGAAPRLVSINAHMSEDSLLPGQPGATDTTPTRADLYTTGDLPSDWRSRLAGRLLYTIGCHAGQALPDSWYGAGNLDFAEAFSSGPYVGNTGWGIADDAATAMSERLLVEYARALNLPGTTAGQALARAKQAYLDGLGLFMGYDEKVLMQATYYGLPMYKLGGAGSATPPSATSWSAGSDLGLTTRSTTLQPDLSTRTTPQGNHQQVAGQAPLVSPGNPILARLVEQLPQVSGATPKDGLVLSLQSSAVSGPTAVAAESFGGEVLPERVDDIAFPSSLTAVSGQRLTVIASRVDANSTASTTTGVTEKFNRVGVRVYYSPSPDTTQPFVTSTAVRNGTSSQTITVRARDDGGPTKAAYLLSSTGGPGSWTGVWMTPQGNDTYTATIPCAGDVRWFTQVVDGAGNVGIDMKRGYFGQCSKAAPVFEVGTDAQIIENTEFVRITSHITDADSDRFTGTFDFGTGPQEMEIVKGPDGEFRAVVQVAGLHAGTYSVVVTVCDDSGLCTSRTFALTVLAANTAPQSTVALNTTSPVPGQTLVATGQGADADGDPVTLSYQWYLNGDEIAGATGSSLDLDDVPDAERGDTVTVTVTPNDGRIDGGGASASAIIRLNTAPVVEAGPNVNASEGTAAGWAATVTDPHGDAITSAVVDYGDGSAPQDVTPSGGSIPLSHTYVENGSYTVTVSATDEHGATGSDTTTVVVANVAPTILPNPSPAAPVQTGSPTTISVAWTDPGAQDSFTVTVAWGDGTSDTYPVPAGTHTLTASHTYATANTYVIAVTVADDDGGSVTEAPYDFGVVFDSTAGYVTANGYYVSPSGAWPANSSASGQAEFGLQARFTTGSSAPTGKFRFTYDITPLDHGCAAATCLELDSTSFSSLVVSGNKATLKGSGRLNGATGYTFLISVIDGNPDRVRIKIVRGLRVIYDSQPGAAESADPTVPLTGGSVLLKRAT